MRNAAQAACLVLLTGCWQDEWETLPTGARDFSPSPSAPEGWVVAPFEVPLACPDGLNAQFWAVYPMSAADGEPVDTVLVLHAGAFDYVVTAQPGAPTVGLTVANPSRLSAEWAAHQVLETLGVAPSFADVGFQDGTLASALVSEGLALLLPGNCWGDFWSNRRAQADNDVTADGFVRNGRTAAEWAYGLLTDPAFAAGINVELPFTPSAQSRRGVGLGSGSRGLAELLLLGNDFSAILVDSPLDDLAPYVTGQHDANGITQGLGRLYPDGDTSSGGLWAVDTLPGVVVHVASAGDPLAPPSAQRALLDRLPESAFSQTIDAPMHVVSNREENAPLAAEAVAAFVAAER